MTKTAANMMLDPAAIAGSTLIGPDDPPLFSTVNSQGGAPALLLADHAGRAFPRALDRLGLGDAALDRHIAYDIGVDWLTRRMAQLLDAPALLHAYSRLLIDPNRTVEDPTSICTISDGVIVPGNRTLGMADRAARAQAFFYPYHAAIEQTVDQFLRRGVAPAIISLHSFTPRLRGVDRPWQVGVLWSDDGRMSLPLMAALRADGLCVGDNEPYSGHDMRGYTIEAHAMARGLPHVLIEVRQDLIATPADAEGWAERLAPPLAVLLRDPALTRPA